MTESNASLSNEPVDLLEQVDLVAILKARIPEENANTVGGSQLIEISNADMHKEIINRGQFSRADLEAILENEERLQSAVAFLAKENARLTTIEKSKEEKIAASIDMIVSQRDWVHSLLDDNVALRTEVDRHVKEKLDFDADTAYQISALKNAKEELEDETLNLKSEVQQLENQLADLDDQLKKSTSVFKKSQVHKNALSEKIEAMENNQIKYKWYMGILSAAAFVFFSFAVVSYVNSKTHNKGNTSDQYSNNDESSDTSIASLNGNGSITNPGHAIAQDSPVEVTPEGFVSSEVGEPLLVDNTKVLDDKKVDEILKESISPVEVTDTSKPLKLVNNKKPVSKPTETNTSFKSTKPEIAIKADVSNKTDANVAKNSKTEIKVVPDKKSVKTDVASNKKPKKPNQTYIIQPKDSLYQISKKFYGSGNYVNKIKKDNKLGGSLVPGKKLIISSLEE